MESPGDKDGVNGGAVGDRPLNRPKGFSQGDGSAELSVDVGVVIDVNGGEFGEKYDEESGWSGGDDAVLSDRREFGVVAGTSRYEELGMEESLVMGWLVSIFSETGGGERAEWINDECGGGESEIIGCVSMDDVNEK